MSVRPSNPEREKFNEEVIRTEPITRYMEVQQYIRNVGPKYITENMEKVLLDWWERGVRNG